MKLSSILASVLLLAATTVAQNCTFTNFGRPCGGDLAGSLVRGPAIRMAVTNAAPSSVAVLVVGQTAARPHPLPGSNCLLLVDPRITFAQPVGPRGNTEFLMRLPNVRALDVDFQVVTVASSRNGRTAESH